MRLDFENDYIVAVVVFMIFLIFCKQIFECMSSFCVCSEQCFKTCSQFTCVCLHHDQEECVRIFLISSIVLFSFVQPLLFIGAHAYRHNNGIESYAWTSTFVDFDVQVHNRSSAKQNNSMTLIDDNVRVSMKAYEVDNLMLLLPFSLSCMSSTWAWLTLKSNDVFSSDPLWDDSLFDENKSLWVYETLYYVEFFFLLFGTLVISMQPVDLNLAVMMSLSLSIICFIFFRVGRLNVSNDSEQTQLFILFALMSTLVSVKVGQNVRPSVASLISGGLLMVSLPCLLLQYTRMQAEFKAGNVVLMRTLFANLHLFVFLMLMLSVQN